MALGTYAGNTKFDIVAPFTKRRLTAMSTVLNHLVITMTSAMPYLKVDDIMQLTGVPSSYVGNWKVTAINGNVVKLYKANQYGGLTITVNANSIATRYKYGSGTTSNPGFIPENRSLSQMFDWDTSLTSTTTMCAAQVRAKKFLTQFWSHPDVVAEYKSLFPINKIMWSAFGPRGGYGLTKFVDFSMCVIYGQSLWKRKAVIGNAFDDIAQNGCTGMNGDNSLGFLSLYDDSIEGHTAQTIMDSGWPLGLWGIRISQTRTPFLSKNRPWYSSDTSADNTISYPDYTVYGPFDKTWLNNEWQMRAAAWLMWNRLFNYPGWTGNDVNEINPFAEWHAARVITSNVAYSLDQYELTPTYLNSKTNAAWYATKPPYGTTVCG